MTVRILSLLLSFSLLSGEALAQFGNEWIDYDRQYWRFQAANEGLRRIDYNSLVAAGIPLGSLNPETIRVFGRGQEQHVRLVDGGDGQIDPEDYIELYTLSNDGWLDAEAYDLPEHQVNEQYSLFNDTASYFLTFGASNGLRTSSYVPSANPNELSPIPWVWSEVRQNYTSTYLLGKQDINGIALPFYEEAEGWFDTRFAKGQSREKSLSHPHWYNEADAPNMQVKATSAGASVAPGFYNHHLQVGYGNPMTVMVDTTYYGFQLNRFAFDIPIEQVSGNATTITHRSIDDLNVVTDFNAIAWISLSYARSPNFPEGGSHRFEVIHQEGTSEVRLDFSYGGNSPRLFQEGAGLLREFPLEANGGLYTAVLPNPPAGQSLDLLLIDGGEQALTGPMQPVSSSGFFTNYAASPLDSAFILVTHPKLWSAATNYAFYRESQGMDVLLVNVEELYMQYAAGIWKHPLALRRFCDELLQTWESKPSHLFIAGKSIFEMNISATVGARNNPEHYARNLIPSWGYPTSDLAFTSGLDATLAETAIPTGRLAAEDGQTLLEYLNKVVEFEAQAPAAWMKRILHFGGGGNDFEQTLFASYLNNYRTLAQDTCFGGKVYGFFKTSTDPIQLNLSDSIRTLIEGGASLMTFFGHASNTGFDVNIDDPASYNNQGKYPLLIGNSCYTGNIHLTNSSSASETFTLAPSAGVIGFIAKGDLGAPHQLNMWTENFYRHLFRASYGNSIGQCMKAAVQSFQSANMNLLTHNTALTFALHGDPALVLNAWEKPDYEIRPQDVSFEPVQVSTELENFTVKVAVTNIGKALSGQVGVELIRHFPDGSDTSMVAELNNVFFRDTAYFEVPTDRIRGVGLNTFDVLIDFPADAIDELEELNNNRVFGKELFITSGNLLPVFPYNYAIQPDGEIILKASTGDPLAPNRNYLFEVDTTDGFDSPLLVTETLQQSGGVLSWSPAMNWQDGQVYYWRVAAEEADEEVPNWRMHSFELRSNERGWGQSHHEQFRANQFDKVEWLENPQTFEFATGEQTMRCEIFGSASGSFQEINTHYLIDLQVMEYSGCGPSPALHVAIIDPLTLAPWESNFNGQHPQNNFGNLMDCANGRGRPEKYFIFRQNQGGEMAGLYDLLENEVPEGHYLLIYTWKYADYDGWEANAPGLFQTFSDLGASQVGSAQDSVPFIFFTRMGSPELTQEVYGSSSTDFLEFETTLVGNFGAGRITSPLFGPASSWNSLTWELESQSSDSARVKVFGFGLPAGFTGVEVSDLEAGEGQWIDLQEGLLASNHPQVKLHAALFDQEEQSPPQLKNWRLLGEHVPECALNAHLGFWFPHDTLMQGEPLPVAIAIENIGEYDMDSLLVAYRISGPGLQEDQVLFRRNDSLRVGQFQLDTLYLSTEQLRGDNRLRIEANPRGSANNPDQLEQYHFNNILEKRFHVIEDRINPLLDVTFDGQHIMNGDIVSVQPIIVVQLNDENPWLLLDEPSDTASYKLFMHWPDGQQQAVYFANNPDLTFIPAADERNKSRVEYRPLLHQDGTYRLIVQAQDKSGNASGSIDFQIEFEVYSKPTITEVLNYPNPFSTRTQFVFTVTGAEPPDEILIRIMTISGRVVREIRHDEIGPLKIGRNFTEFWWDGTDAFGDRLANGIYLYSVRARLRGEDIEHRATTASPFFKNGIGKMYLLR